MELAAAAAADYNSMSHTDLHNLKLSTLKYRERVWEFSLSTSNILYRDTLKLKVNITLDWREIERDGQEIL